MKFRRCCGLVIYFFFYFSFTSNGQRNYNEKQTPFIWSKIATNKVLLPVDDAFKGFFNDSFFIAGGIRKDNGRYTDLIQFYDVKQGEVGVVTKKLPKSLAKGTVVSDLNETILIGGETDGGEVSKAIYRLVRSGGNDFRIDLLTSLPEQIQNIKAYKAGEILHIIGTGTDLNTRFYEYRISKDEWRTLPVPGSSGIVISSLTRQNSGEANDLYLTLVDKVSTIMLKYAVKDGSWTRVGQIPILGSDIDAIPLGASHILYGPSPNAKRYLFHTITNTTTEFIDPTLPDNARVYREGDRHFGCFLEGEELMLFKSEVLSANSKIRLLDIAVFAAYILLLFFVSYHFSRNHHNTDDYFRGGKRVPAWIVGISVVAAKLSGITFVSVPAKVYATNWLYFLTLFNSLFLLYFLTKVILPQYQRLNVTSIYEYLEHRFNVVVRILGSLCYLVWELGRAGFMLLLPAFVISAVTSLDVTTSIVFIGVVATLYTLMGGIEGIIWTDAIQIFVMVGGVFLAILVMLGSIDMPINEIIDSAYEQNKLTLFDFDFDLTKVTVVVIVLNWVGKIQEYVSTQSVAQRFVATKDEKEAGRSMLIAAIVVIPVVMMFYMAGTSLFLYYQNHPENLNPMMSHTDSIFPSFIVNELPAGLSGLIIASIFVEAMSGLYSAINSLSTVVVIDFHQRFGVRLFKNNTLYLAKLLVVIFGIFGTVSALILSKYDIKSLLDNLLSFIGLVGGGMAGMFVLGMFTKSANSFGAICGFILSFVIQYYVSTYTNLHFFLYSTIGIFSCFVLGLIFSKVAPLLRIKR